MSEIQERDVENTRDYAKLVWLGIGGMFVLMLAYMFLHSDDVDYTRSVVRARHILIKFNPGDPSDRQRSLELASSIRERLIAGEDFKRLAQDYSDDAASAGRGGDLDYAPKGTFQAEFDKQVWALPVGEISDIVITNHGFHIIQVLDRRLSKMDEYQAEIERKADEMLKQ